MKNIIFGIFIGLVSPLTVWGQNILVVSQAGGDYSNPVSALNAIGTTLPAASASNRYLVKITPGVYNVTTPVNLQPFVDLEGSGVRTTVLRGNIDWMSGGDTVGVQGVVNAASRSEIRNLTVRNTQSSSSAIAIGVHDTQGTLISNVRSISRGNADSSANWKYGMRIVDSNNVRIRNVTARGTSGDPTLCQGAAIRNSSVTIYASRFIGATCNLGLGLSIDDGSVVNIKDSNIRGEGSINGLGISASADTLGDETQVRIKESNIQGQILSGLPAEAGLTTTSVIYSELNGSVSGNVSCLGAYDASLNPLTSACLP